MNKSKVIVQSSQELADALGLTSEDAARWDMVSRIIKTIEKIMKEKKLTHEQVASLVGCSRSRLTKLLNYQTKGMSIDFMLRVPTKLGYKPALRFSKIA